MPMPVQTTKYQTNMSRVAYINAKPRSTDYIMKETTRAGSRRHHTWRRFEFIRVDKILRAIGFGGSEAGNKESGDGFGGHC